VPNSISAKPGSTSSANPESLGEQLAGLAGAAYGRGDHRVDPLGQRSQPVGGGADLLAALVAEPGVGAGEPAGEPLLARVRGHAVPDQDQRRLDLPPPGDPARLALLGLVGRLGRRDVLLADGDDDAVPLAVERLVGQPVGVLVLLARHPGVRRPERRQPVGLERQRLHVDVLDLPVAGHLLHDELGVHPDLDLGVRSQVRGHRQPGDQAAVLRHVVARDADASCRPRRSPPRCRRP
jgi:hypothetical protein